MTNRRSCFVTVLIAATVAGCGSAEIRSTGEHRLLTEIEMDGVSAGSATAIAEVRAVALGLVPRTTATSDTLASSGIMRYALPFPNLLTLDYASSYAMASASNAPFTEASGLVHIGVDGSGGGASINAESLANAAGSRSSASQINMRFHGLSIGRTVDLVFGTAVASACCAPVRRAQITAEGSGGGYWRSIEAFSVAIVPGQLQSRIDISVVASSLPVLDAGQVSALIGPALLQSVGQ
jgi:hypothetical protein